MHGAVNDLDNQNVLMKSVPPQGLCSTEGPSIPPPHCRGVCSFSQPVHSYRTGKMAMRTLHVPEHTDAPERGPRSTASAGVFICRTKRREQIKLPLETINHRLARYLRRQTRETQGSQHIKHSRTNRYPYKLSNRENKFHRSTSPRGSFFMTIDVPGRRNRYFS